LAQFALTLGHYTEVLEDKKRVDREIAADDTLRRWLHNISSLSDPWMRATWTQNIYDRAAANIIRRLSITVLDTPKQ
jgi:hypothetical protein